MGSTAVCYRLPHAQLMHYLGPVRLAGDLYQIYALCRRDDNEFNLAYISSDFTEESTEGFDPVYMSKLYKRGYEWFSLGNAPLDL